MRELGLLIGGGGAWFAAGCSSEWTYVLHAHLMHSECDKAAECSAGVESDDVRRYVIHMHLVHSGIRSVNARVLFKMAAMLCDVGDKATEGGWCNGCVLFDGPHPCRPNRG